jgi:hypothetical protein
VCLVVKVVVTSTWSCKQRRGRSQPPVSPSGFGNQRGLCRGTIVSKPQTPKHDVPFGLSPWSCLWSRGVESMSLVLGCVGKTQRRTCGFRDRGSRLELGELFRSRIKDPNREVMQPLGGIGGLHHFKYSNHNCIIYLNQFSKH